MKIKLLVCIASMILSLFLAACSTSESDSQSNSSLSDSPSVTQQETPAESETEQEDSSWKFISETYPHITYDDTTTETYDDQYVILSAVLDNIEYDDLLNWVECRAWFQQDDTYIMENITFECDEINGYSPQELKDGDNVDICFYINADGSFGSNIKGYSITDKQTSLDSIYSSFKQRCSILEWNNIMQDPEGLWGTPVTINGDIIQIISDDGDYVELISSTPHDNEYVKVSYHYQSGDPQYLEGDEITVYGMYYILYDYTSPSGDTQSIPAIAAEFIDSNVVRERESETPSVEDESNYNSDFSGPDEVELMSYAQTVLTDFFPECEYSHNKVDYVFVQTGLRYKIEGKVSITEDSSPENFYMIINFVDENYDYYDLISLQIGDEIIYE